jgi:hypothetical protein
MSMTDAQHGETGTTTANGSVDLKPEVVVLPVADADRSSTRFPPRSLPPAPKESFLPSIGAPKGEMTIGVGCFSPQTAA